jgi:hypothetical protein
MITFGWMVVAPGELVSVGMIWGKGK